MVGADAVRILFDFLRTKAALLDLIQDGLWIIAKADPQMVDKVHFPPLINLGVKAQLRERWPAVYQRTARVVANTTEDRGTNTGRADHRVRIAAEWMQQLLKLKE